MATKNRIFISFAADDRWAKEYLVGQAKNASSPFEFVNMSINEPFDERWKTQCRSRIKGCDGVIALISKNTATADGAIWEVKVAKEERVPIIAIYTTSENRPYSLPSEFNGIVKANWTWLNIKTFLDGL
jgi:hypothetical protein